MMRDINADILNSLNGFWEITAMIWMTLEAYSLYSGFSAQILKDASTSDAVHNIYFMLTAFVSIFVHNESELLELSCLKRVWAPNKW